MANELLKNSDGEPLPQRLQQGQSISPSTGDDTVFEVADASVPDGADKAQGATGDSAKTDETTSGTVISWLKGMVKLLKRLFVSGDQTGYSAGDDLLPLGTLRSNIANSPVDDGDWGPLQHSDEGGLWTHSVIVQKEDQSHSSGAFGHPLLAVRNNTALDSLVNSDGDYTLLQTNGQGQLRTEALAKALDTNGNLKPMYVVDPGGGEFLLKVADQNQIRAPDNDITIFGVDGGTRKAIKVDNGQLVTKEDPADRQAYTNNLGASAQELNASGAEVLEVVAHNLNGNELVWLKFFDKQATNVDLANDYPSFGLPLGVGETLTVSPGTIFSSAISIAVTQEEAAGNTAPSGPNPTVTTFIRT